MSFVVNLSSLLLGVLLACQKADAIFMWTGPPPAWNQTVSGTDNIQTAVMRVLIGSKNVHLRWNYTLLNGQNILLTTFSILGGNNEPKVLGNVVNGNPIYDKEEYKSRFSISSTDEFSIVTINTLMERDNTTFQCKIYPGKQWAYNIRLEVTAPPKITSISDGRTVKKGDVLSLKCTADGYPAPNITWTRLSDNSVVTMPLNVTGEQDEGGYRCTADNGFGNPDSRDVSITLLHPPEIIKPKKATWEIMSGETASIECRAKGIPSPQYVWTNAAGKIVSRGKYPRFLEVSDSDGGNYVCNASNILGSASFTLTIQITTPPVSRKPSLLTITPSTPVSVTPEKKERKESSETSSDDTSRNMLIGVAVGGFVVVAGILTVAVLLCRRNTKRRNKDECRNSQDQRGVGNQSNHHSVFMDGFQNNKMDNPGYTFTQVDMPKKPKKKSKPGETNYADLANFQRSHKSLLSFSSHPPTPVKKPAPYVKTEYAEITHFIRGGNTDLRTPGANPDRNIAGNIEAIM